MAKNTYVETDEAGEPWTGSAAGCVFLLFILLVILSIAGCLVDAAVLNFLIKL